MRRRRKRSDEKAIKNLHSIKSSSVEHFNVNNSRYRYKIHCQNVHCTLHTDPVYIYRYVSKPSWVHRPKMKSEKIKLKIKINSQLNLFECFCEISTIRLITCQTKFHIIRIITILIEKSETAVKAGQRKLCSYTFIIRLLDLTNTNWEYIINANTHSSILLSFSLRQIYDIREIDPCEPNNVHNIIF